MKTVLPKGIARKFNKQVERAHDALILIYDGAEDLSNRIDTSDATAAQMDAMDDLDEVLSQIEDAQRLLDDISDTIDKLRKHSKRRLS